MAKTKKPKLNAAEKLLAAKKLLIQRLHGEIAGVRADGEERVKAIERRIRIAKTLVDALENGTLKP